ncbi:hypothetical protein JXR93_03575 [bacterium]|nr:hypothetical protein [bacterium]
MVRFKISVILLGVILALLLGIYYIFSYTAKGDTKEILSSQLKQSGFYVRESLLNDNLFYQARISEWAISNEIAENIVAHSEAHQDLKDVSKKRDDLLSSLKKENISEKDKSEIEKKVLEHEEEIKKYSEEIQSVSNLLKTKLSSFVRPINADFYALVGDNLQKWEELEIIFALSKEFQTKVLSGEASSDIWLRGNLFHKVHGVPIKLGNKTVATLFIGFIQNKKSASLIANVVDANVSYIFDSQITQTEIESTDLQVKLKQLIKSKEELFKQYYNDDDVSNYFTFDSDGTTYIGVFIPTKNFQNKTAGIILTRSFDSLKLKSVAQLKYGIPIFTAILLFLMIIISMIIGKNFIKPFTDVEIALNQYIDGEDIRFNPSEMGEAEGLARSLNRVFLKSSGKIEQKPATWDDPIFVMELNQNVQIDKKRTKDHFDVVYDLFIKGHINNSLPYAHIKKDEFKERLKRIEERLKEKHGISDIYFEVMVDNGVVKIHPSVVSDKKRNS